jgi:hypothetical protein
VVTFGVHECHGAELGDVRHRRPELAGRQVTEIRIAGVGEETLEPRHACTRQRLELLDVLRHHASPEVDIDATVALRGSLLDAQCLDAGGDRIGVQRHIHQRGDAACGSRRRSGREAFPVGARLVDVHVGVDESGQ